MKFVATLLASVSLSALLASAPAHAQSPGVVIEATGGYAMGSNDPATAFIGSGTSSETINPLSGYYAGLRIGKQIMPLWDITGRIASTDVKGSASYVYPGTPGIVSDKLGQLNDELAFQTLDLEAGYTPTLGGNLDLRFFGGLRGLHYTTALDASETSSTFFPFVSSNTNNTSYRGEFYGVGPRVGLELGTRLGNSPLGISGMAAGAVVVGNATGSRTSDKVGSLSPPSVTDTGGPRTLIDLEGSLGLDYHVSDDVVLTGGYRAEVLSGIGNFDSTGDAQLVHGPFARIKAGF